MSRFTKEQQQAIDEEGKSIIVSAGAGSGKTAVLSERVLRKLKDGVNIQNLLVLTFTNEAANEMKNRIRNKIVKDESLQEQLNYIDASYITTFDSYALSIVKKYHYLLNISNKVNIIDSNIILSLKDKILDDIFDELYCKREENFVKLINDFCTKDDSSIKNSIKNISKSLDLKIDKESYLKSYLDNYYNDNYLNNVVKQYEELIKNKIDEIKTKLYLLENYCSSSFYEKMSESLFNLFNSKGYNEYRKNVDISLPRVNKDLDEEGKLVKEEINGLLKELKKLLNYETTEEIKETILSTKNYIIAIINIINELDCRINKYKYEKDVYEFTDINKLAIKIVRENDEIKEELKQYYNEILVDEYQDTNDLQEEFINLIANNNVYMVGDIKQSIYRFRNANPTIFKNKYNDYSKNNNGIKIDLLKNFRSREEVLNNINLMFDLIMDDFLGGASYKKSHRMNFGNSSYIEEGKTNQNYNLDIYNYSPDNKYLKEEIEAFIIATDINNKISSNYQIFDKDEKVLRKLTYSDICIIMDRGTSFETYKRIFEYMRVPLVIYADEKLTNEDDILVLKNILNFIIKINRKEFDKQFRYYYMSIARSFVFDKNDADIFLKLKENKIYETDIFKIAQNISNELNHLSSLELLNKAIEDYDIYNKLITIGDIEKSMIRIENLQNICYSLEDLEYTPSMLVDYLNEMTNSALEIKYSLNTKFGNSVKIMNIHKSKGLEFNICYFSGLYKEFNISDLKEKFFYSNKYGIISPYYKNGIGTTILKELEKEKYMIEEISERIRLFYVALTRCKEKMIMVTSIDSDSIIENNDVIDNNIRMKYKSFLDILKSIKGNLNQYIKNIDLNNIMLTKDYQISKQVNISDLIDEKKELIDVRCNNISLEKIENKHASKEVKKLISKEEFNNINYGTYMHYLFEISDFYKQSNNNCINNFIKQIDLLKVINIYKEHEFIYEKDSISYHGIIDLILEYEDHYKIVDYKLKKVTDKNYLNQINIYKNYLESITNKPIKTYLYSILEERLHEI